MIVSAAVIGAGPAGLMSAEVLSAAGVAVTVHEAMPSAGRKLLMAGRGGLNLTHSEPMDRFLGRYGSARGRIAPMVEAFGPADLTAWAEGLGQGTFVGSSGRVFPKAMKASPLLRAWLARLAGRGVELKLRSRWTGWDADSALSFAGGEPVRPDATLLALGGASWPRLGSDGAWTGLLSARGVEIAPLRAANSGFEAAWSDHFKDRFAGEPLKRVALSFDGRTVKGEAMVTRRGLEGGAVYALSAALRDAISTRGEATLHIDLRPDLDAPALRNRLARAARGDSLSNRLRKAAGLSPAAIGVLREGWSTPLTDPGALADAIKAAPVVLTGVASLERAISTAGGVAFAALDEGLQLNAIPGVWVAGEMLDWEAPTGGYLLQACFASGVWAAKAMLS